MPRPNLAVCFRARGVRLLLALAPDLARGLALALFVCVSLSMAQGGTTKLRVATRIVPPMVIEKNGILSGFSIELWNNIGERLNRETEYVVMSDVSELLDAVENGGADLGIAAISITSERENRFDFSQPIMNSGLQILVRGTAPITASAIPRHLKPLSAQKLAMLPSTCGTFSVHPMTVSLFSPIADDVSERPINKGPCDWWPDFYLSSRSASVAGRGGQIDQFGPPGLIFVYTKH